MKIRGRFCPFHSICEKLGQCCPFLWEKLFGGLCFSDKFCQQISWLHLTVLCEKGEMLFFLFVPCSKAKKSVHFSAKIFLSLHLTIFFVKRKGTCCPFFWRSSLGGIKRKGNVVAFLYITYFVEFLCSIRGNAAHFLLRFCHLVVKIGRNASPLFLEKCCSFRLLNLEGRIRGKCCPFFWEKFLSLQFHNLEIWGKCCPSFLRESALVCKFAMSKRVKICSFFWSSFCSLSISQFADKPTSASPYLAFLFDSASDAPLLRLEVLTFTLCGPDLGAMCLQFRTHEHTKVKNFSTPRCTQTDTHTHIHNLEEKNKNKKCLKGPPRIWGLNEQLRPQNRKRELK